MKNIVRVIIALVITAIVLIIGITRDTVKDENNNVTALAVNDTLTTEEIISNFLKNNHKLFNFYEETFDITHEDLLQQLIIDNNNNIFNAKDIGNSGNIYNSLDLNIIDYLSNLEKSNPELFSNKQVVMKYSKNDIYNLLKYFTTLYNDVDYETLAAIAYVETGNLSSNYMVNNGNIYGGIANAKLIKYKNIRYGILNYVKLMHNRYYSKGLNTISKIGYIYNPVVNNGVKQANPNWVANVTNAKSKIPNYDINSFYDL